MLVDQVVERSQHYLEKENFAVKMILAVSIFLKHVPYCWAPRPRFDVVMALYGVITEKYCIVINIYYSFQTILFKSYLLSVGISNPVTRLDKIYVVIKLYTLDVEITRRLLRC